jgi:hypothetical protein
VSIDQVPRDEVSPELACRIQAWKDGYPWLERAIKEIGPGARAASDSWRVRIEDELKTTLDFKIRPDGTAVVWCGMSGYDFHHDPSTKELFEGLAEAYRRELKRRRRHMERVRRPVPSPPKPQFPHFPAWPPPASDSLTWKVMLLARMADLTTIFLVTTALTFVLSAVAILVR